MLLDALVDRRAAAEVPVLGSFIGGMPTDPGDTLIDVGDPATGRRLARIEDAGIRGIEAAVAAANVAAAAWRRTPARERGALIGELAGRITANAERLATLDTLDTGNPITAMRADVAKGVANLFQTKDPSAPATRW